MNTEYIIIALVILLLLFTTCHKATAGFVTGILIMLLVNASTKETRPDANANANANANDEKVKDAIQFWIDNPKLFARGVKIWYPKLAQQFAKAAQQTTPEQVLAYFNKQKPAINAFENAECNHERGDEIVQTPACDGKNDPVSLESISPGDGYCLHGRCYEKDTLMNLRPRRDPYTREELSSSQFAGWREEAQQRRARSRPPRRSYDDLQASRFGGVLDTTPLSITRQLLADVLQISDYLRPRDRLSGTPLANIRNDIDTLSQDYRMYIDNTMLRRNVNNMRESIQTKLTELEEKMKDIAEYAVFDYYRLEMRWNDDRIAKHLTKIIHFEVFRAQYAEAEPIYRSSRDDMAVIIGRLYIDQVDISRLGDLERELTSLFQEVRVENEHRFSFLSELTGPRRAAFFLMIFFIINIGMSIRNF